MVVKDPISLDDSADSGVPSHERLANPVNSVNPIKIVMQRQMRRLTARVLRTLSPKEPDIVRRRFGIADAEELDRVQIGTIYSVTRERIRQIENQALG